MPIVMPIGAPIVFDQPVAQSHHAVAVLGDLGFMGHDDDGLATAMELVEQRHDLHGRRGIEVAGGLVGQQDRRLAHQGARHRDALALAAGELVGQVVHARAQADALQRKRGLSPTLGDRQAPVDQRLHHVV